MASRITKTHLVIGLVSFLSLTSAYAAEQSTTVAPVTGSVTKTVVTTPEKPAVVTEGTISAVALRPLPPMLPSLTLTTSTGQVTVAVDPLHTKVWDKDKDQAVALERLKPGVHVKVTHAIVRGQDTASVIKLMPATGTSASTAPATTSQ